MLYLAITFLKYKNLLVLDMKQCLLTSKFKEKGLEIQFHDRVFSRHAEAQGSILLLRVKEQYYAFLFIKSWFWTGSYS